MILEYKYEDIVHLINPEGLAAMLQVRQKDYKENNKKDAKNLLFIQQRVTK